MSMCPTHDRMIISTIRINKQVNKEINTHRFTYSGMVWEWDYVCAVSNRTTGSEYSRTDMKTRASMLPFFVTGKTKRVDLFCCRQNAW